MLFSSYCRSKCLEILSHRTIEDLRAIPRYVGNYEFRENGFKDHKLQAAVSKLFDDISTSCLKHHITIIVFNETVTLCNAKDNNNLIVFTRHFPSCRVIDINNY